MLKEIGKAREGESMRSMLETYIDVLFVIGELGKSGGAKRTHIMYKSNTSWNRLQEQLNYYIKEEFVEEIGVGKVKLYRLADRGRKAVERYNREGATCLADIFGSLMRAKRDTLEIHLGVLKIINDGEKKPTHIMYRSNMSWKPMQKILANLMDEELVEETVSGDSRRYTITEKGKNVLKTPSLLEAGRYKKNAANETA